MFIIIEGCDGTGKTTLVNSLKEQTGFEIIKFSQPKTKNPYKEYIDFIKENRNKNLILDRFWIGETIYGPIYRGKGLKSEEIEKLKSLTKNDIYIIAHTNDGNIEKVFKERGEDFTKLEDIQKINGEFFKFLSNNFKPGLWFMYDLEFMGNKLEYFYNTYIKDKLK